MSKIVTLNTQNYSRHTTVSVPLKNPMSNNAYRGAFNSEMLIYFSEE